MIAALMLASLTVGLGFSRADEPVKLALVSPGTTSIATTSHASANTTNAARPALKASSADTNSLSLTFTKSLVKTSLATNAVPPSADDLQSVARITVVITKNPEPGGFFSGQGGNGSFGFANIQAGYGQAYDCDSITLRGRNGTAWEETRYLFFKKVVKF